jgi:hypothetical protein
VTTFRSFAPVLAAGAESGVPQKPQNANPSGFSRPQEGQIAIARVYGGAVRGTACTNAASVNGIDETLGILRGLSQQLLITNSLRGVCQLLLATGQFERAEPLAQELQDDGFAMATAGLERDEDALRLEAAVDAKWEELGVAARPRVLETWRERDLGGARARLGEPQASAALVEGRAMAWEEAVEFALGKKPGLIGAVDWNLAQVRLHSGSWRTAGATRSTRGPA